MVWTRKAPAETFAGNARHEVENGVSADRRGRHHSAKSRKLRVFLESWNGRPAWREWVVVEPVCSELVSAWEFPDLQGIIRELSPELAFLTISASAKLLKSHRFSSRFPAQRDQGSSSAEQGRQIVEQGNSEAHQALLRYDALREHDAQGETIHGGRRIKWGRGRVRPSGLPGVHHRQVVPGNCPGPECRMDRRSTRPSPERHDHPGHTLRGDRHPAQ
jgi:hypothetical protein